MALTKQTLAATYLFAALTYFVFICVVLLPIGNLLSLRFTFETNYNEGWNVYNADRLVHGEQIYDDNYWRINNYPIASFLIVGAVNSFLDDLLLSGRLVALVSFAAIGVFAAMAIRRLGGGRTDAVFGAGCAMGFCYLVAPAWIIADDPQTLGEAVMLGALVSYIARPPDRLNLLRTAFLVVLGGFINGVATFTFVATGAIVWEQAAVMTLGAIVGGYFGAHYAQRLPQTWIRAFVIATGSAMTVYFFVRAYL